jgi:hypothetical protein
MVWRRDADGRSRIARELLNEDVGRSFDAGNQATFPHAHAWRSSLSRYVPGTNTIEAGVRAYDLATRVR